MRIHRDNSDMHAHHNVIIFWWWWQREGVKRMCWHFELFSGDTTGLPKDIQAQLEWWNVFLALVKSIKKQMAYMSMMWHVAKVARCCLLTQMIIRNSWKHAGDGAACAKWLRLLRSSEWRAPFIVLPGYITTHPVCAIHHPFPSGIYVVIV